MQISLAKSDHRYIHRDIHKILKYGQWTGVMIATHGTEAVVYCCVPLGSETRISESEVGVLTEF